MLLRARERGPRFQESRLHGQNQGNIRGQQGKVRLQEDRRRAQEPRGRCQPQEGQAPDGQDGPCRDIEEEEAQIVRRRGRARREERDRDGLQGRRAEQEVDDGRLAVRVPVREMLPFPDHRHGVRRRRVVGPLDVAEPRADDAHARRRLREAQGPQGPHPP